MSQGIRQPTADVSKVRECLVCGLGAVLGREMEADSRTQSPGELCQTRLQDTGYYITEQASLLILINSHPCTLVSSEEGNMQSHTERCSCPYLNSHSKASIYICLWTYKNLNLTNTYVLLKTVLVLVHFID